jgi:uncharacterized protein YoxC
MTQNIIIIVLVLILVIHFFYTKRLIKKLLDYIAKSKEIYDATQKDYNTLNNQYRQLAKINEALRDVNKVKNGGKKK